MAAKSSSRGSAAASEIRVYIQDDNHDKENIEDQDNIEKMSSEASVNSQELEETPQKKKCITKRSSVKKGNAARWSNDLILRLTDEYEAQPCPWEAIFSVHIFTRKEPGTSCSRDFACVTAGELSSTITNFFGRLTT